MAFLLYPLYLITFWYVDIVKGFTKFFVAFNRYLVSLLSFSLLLKTFFKPLKNEYRDGLVLFSIIAGIIIKFIILCASGLFIGVVLIIEVFVILFVITFPLLVIFLILGKKFF